MPVVQPNNTLTTALLQALIAADELRIKKMNAETSAKGAETQRRNQQTIAALNEFTLGRTLYGPDTPLAEAPMLHGALDRLSALSGSDIHWSENPLITNMVVNPTSQQDQLAEYAAGLAQTQLETSGLTQPQLETLINKSLFGQPVQNAQLESQVLMSRLFNENFESVADNPRFVLGAVRAMAGLDPNEEYSINIPGLGIVNESFNTPQEMAAYVDLLRSTMAYQSAVAGSGADLAKVRSDYLKSWREVIQNTMGLDVPLPTLDSMLTDLQEGTFVSPDGTFDIAGWRGKWGDQFDSVVTTYLQPNVMLDKAWEAQMASMGPLGLAMVASIQEIQAAAKGMEKDQALKYIEQESAQLEKILDSIAKENPEKADILRRGMLIRFRDPGFFSRRGPSPVPGAAGAARAGVGNLTPQEDTGLAGEAARHQNDLAVASAFNRIFAGGDANEALMTLGPEDKIKVIDMLERSGQLTPELEAARTEAEAMAAGGVAQ